MAISVEEALQDAIDELKANENVVDVEIPLLEAEEKPCGYIARVLTVFHKVEGQEGYTFDSKIVYINTTDFTYKWHFGGIKMPEPT